MSQKPAAVSQQHMALLVHSDMAVLAKFQAAFGQKDFRAIVARDLPTALLAITQHHFEVAIVSSHLKEAGDGWPLAGVLHLVFPSAFVAVVSPTEPDVLTLQAAINYGAREVFPSSTPPEQIVGSIAAQVSTPSSSAKKSRLQ
jgi:DNA-binding NtrC family response regulator